jgi:hypothetical protein
MLGVVAFLLSLVFVVPNLPDLPVRAAATEPPTDPAALDAEGKVAAFRKLADEAIAEQTIFLNCLLFDDKSFAMMEKNWRDMASETAAILAKAGVPAADIRAFRERAETENLLMLDRPVREVRSLCAGDPEWPQRMYRLDMILLQYRAKDLFGVE